MVVLNHIYTGILHTVVVLNRIYTGILHTVVVFQLTVGGVRFIKWAQDPLVSFVKCDPPSILPCGGNKHYNAFKDILAPNCFVPLLSTWNGTSG